MEQSTPIIHLNNQLRRVNTLGSLVPLEPEDTNPDGLQRGTNKDFKNLRALLKKCAIAHVNRKETFWPDQLLRRILTKERVKEELESMQQSHPGVLDRDVSWYLDQIVPEDKLDNNAAKEATNGVETGPKSPPGTFVKKCYLKIFAILIICERGAEIKNFIDEEVCDDDLPLVQRESNDADYDFQLVRRYAKSRKLNSFRDWRVSEVEDIFARIQYQFLVPYLCFSSNPDNRIQHPVYDHRIILPFVREDEEKCGYGGYGKVECMRIHPACHGFGETVQVRAGNGMFAIKSITTKDKLNDFKKESKMLRKFSGQHDHLIMLLMTYSWGEGNYLLFPWADSDLGTYWNNEVPPYNLRSKIMDAKSIQWLSKQIYGLTSGLDQMHNPQNLDLSTAKTFGRHGDLKPSNIFWLRSEQDTSGILVIGDLGISAAHRAESRSNQPNKDLPHSPDYRPPECDQEGGTISRAFDIWTLGCLFLEMVCWALGGKELVQQFATERSEVRYLGSETFTNIFFDIQKLDTGEYVILVKPCVFKWIYKLHEHPGCTQYFHDLLDIIQRDMIVVLSEKCKRIQSGALLEHIGVLHSKVARPLYSQQRITRTVHQTLPVGVRVVLNEHARKRAERSHAQLNTYQWKTINSMTKSEMEEID